MNPISIVSTVAIPALNQLCDEQGAPLTTHLGLLYTWLEVGC
ncbi:MAG: hypothetical protein SFY66_07630 [Oculatellaceae cyanobacterium bins.114]|nr:hypothetical protein [Oculatellaceae cyanobacterium bins.114]